MPHNLSDCEDTLDTPAEDKSKGLTPVRAADLRQQIERLQAMLADQQRGLMRVPDENVRAAALRSTAVLVRQLVDLGESTRQLEQDLHVEAGERNRLRALQEVGAAVNSSLDLEVVLQQVMDAIVRLTRAERAMLLLDNDGVLEVKMARNISQETLAPDSVDISRSIVRQVAATGEAVVTINAQEDERFSAQHSIVSYKLRSILCAPLKLKGETIGVLYADNRVASGIFGDADRDLLAAFADQSAAAIDNARLFRTVIEIKQLLDNVFASIASGVITIDAADRIALFNRAAETIVGVPASAILSRDYRIVLPLLGLPIDHLVEAVKADGRSRTAEVDLAAARRRTRAATVQLVVSPLRSPANEQLDGVALLLDDVSEKKRVESLRRYLPPALVDRVRDLDAAQRPQRRKLTVLFADIRDFSHYGEYLDPEALIDLANGFFSEAVAVISEHQGLIDKFTGDAVMALFNTPLNPQDDHTEQAVRAALGIQARLAARQREMPSDKVLHVGIGVHTGEAVVGNVGSEQRKDYSAVGDVVNLCKRLQEMAGPDETLVSRVVYERVSDHVRAEPLPPVQVKGRQTLEEVFRLVGPAW